MDLQCISDAYTNILTLFEVNGSVFGSTPVALTTKSQPYRAPFVSSTYTGQLSEKKNKKKQYNMLLDFKLIIYTLHTFTV